MEIVSGFLMGIIGSIHCLGMCGPIALAVPGRSDDKFTLVIDSLVYNLSRTLTYVIMGFLVGLLGTTVSFAGYQEFISIIAGVLLLLVVIIPRNLESWIANIGIIKSFGDKLKLVFRKFFGKRTIASLFMIGILNGLLPCGLVYTALIAAIAYGSITGAMTFMLFFGLGTLPMLATVFVLKSVLSLEIRKKINKFVPVGIAVVAVILILRGMSLGIPFISPVLPEQVQEKAKCCQESELN